VHFVGRIDREKFAEISMIITTDEVIITDERIAHIEERHPGDFATLKPYLQQALQEPDFVLEAPRPNTAIVLKNIDAVFGKLVVRLHVPQDPIERKNSIITAMVIDERTWNRLVKNKKVLYKRA